MLLPLLLLLFLPVLQLLLALLSVPLSCLELWPPLRGDALDELTPPDGKWSMLDIRSHCRLHALSERSTMAATLAQSTRRPIAPTVYLKRWVCSGLQSRSASLSDDDDDDPVGMLDAARRRFTGDFAFVGCTTMRSGPL